jgi:hypothetical protein
MNREPRVVNYTRARPQGDTTMNKIIAIAALITIALAAYGASAGPYDSAGSFPSNYAHSQKK